jgi:phosphate acetyltransferase
MSLSPFVLDLIERNKDNPKSAVLAEGEDSRCIEAASLLLNWGASKTITLLGRSLEIASRLPEPLRKFLDQKLYVLDPRDPNLQADTAAHLLAFNLKRGKPVSLEDVGQLKLNPLYQAGTMIMTGAVDCGLAGAASPTSDVIRAALRTVGLGESTKTVSGLFFLNRAGDFKSRGTFLFADCGVVIEPSLEQLIDIAVSSCETWKHIMGTPPVVAFLSFSTKGSANHPLAEKMAEANRLFRKKMPDVESDGELQFDAAFDATIGLRKAPGSAIPGRANIFIFPDLNSGNIAYKIAQRLGQFDAYGPILQGLSRPYSDLSRGASALDIAVSVLTNSLRA